MTDPVVLVPLDGSKNALRALPVAKGLADLEKARLRYLHVTDKPAPPGQTARSLGLEPADLRDATLEVRAGKPEEAILAAAADRGAALIVMCTHTADVPPAGAVGDAALAVLRDAGCPVVLVNPARARGSWTLKRLLAPHDGSPTVSHALKSATECARQAHAEFVVLQVAHEARALETGSITPPVYLDQVHHSWPAWSAEFLARLSSVCPLPDVTTRLLMGHGDPAAETLRVADEESADLIVLSWKGVWEPPHASTLKAVLRDAPCPVMVTRVAAAA